MHIVTQIPAAAPLFLAGVLLFATLATAEQFTGRVVNVTDGNTVTVRGHENKWIRVRINGIDAPEKAREPLPGQPYADKARKNLIEFAKGKTAVVTWHKHDKYGRVVGRVDVNGADVALEQLRAGLAWLYTEYIGDVPEPDRSAYVAAERQARAAGAGLWQDANPMPPWVWRKAMREAAQTAEEQETEP